MSNLNDLAFLAIDNCDDQGANAQDFDAVGYDAAGYDTIGYNLATDDIIIDDVELQDDNFQDAPVVDEAVLAAKGSSDVDGDMSLSDVDGVTVNNVDDITSFNNIDDSGKIDDYVNDSDNRRRDSDSDHDAGVDDITSLPGEDTHVAAVIADLDSDMDLDDSGDDDCIDIIAVDTGVDDYDKGVAGDDDWVTVAEYGSGTTANLVATSLEAMGIDVIVVNETVNSVIPLGFDPVQLKVPAAKVNPAMEIVKQWGNVH